jgi:uncharacterized protein (TIGR02452 family)
MEANCRLTLENIKLTPEICQKYPQEIEHSIKNTVKYDDVRKLDIPKELKADEKAVVEVIYEDSADTAYQLQKEGLNPLILNMASDYTPGGGWRKGATAQEESLFYRSLYYLALEDRCFYPLALYSAIYTPKVFFFRSKQLDGYKILPYEECSFISCLAMPALRKPVLSANGKYTSQHRKVMTEKIRGIFKIAALHKHDAVVLGAFGNGAFRNPPQDVAEIFREVIKEYTPYFKKIVFAILDYGPHKNFPVFQKVLTG